MPNTSDRQGHATKFPHIVCLLCTAFVVVELSAPLQFLLKPLRKPHFDNTWDLIVVISFTGSPRESYIKNHLKELQSTKYFFLAGVNGSYLVQHPEDKLWKSVSPEFLSRYTAGELGCALSHRLAYELVSKSRMKSVLVVEDDAQFTPEFPSHVQEARASISDSWRIIHWHTFNRNASEHGRKLINKYLYTATQPTEFYGTVCYEINYMSALELLKETSPVRCGADGPTAMFGVVPFQDYIWLGPGVTQSSGKPSTINAIDQSQGFSRESRNNQSTSKS